MDFESFETSEKVNKFAIPIFVTEHLPKRFYEQKRLWLML